MLGKVKKWLGIEGVKLELVLPEVWDSDMGRLAGKLRFRSKNTSEVTAVHIVLVERYSRGRKEEQRIDEYQLGRLTLEDPITIPGNGELVEVDFVLPFERMRAPIDEFGDRNPINGSLAWIARKLRRVKSTFRIEAEAEVKGVALNPFDKKEVNL
ncbi:MAG: hypothetical protein AAGF87_01635 [Bacteroidota bacterium]